MTICPACGRKNPSIAAVCKDCWTPIGTDSSALSIPPSELDCVQCGLKLEDVSLPLGKGDSVDLNLVYYPNKSWREIRSMDLVESKDKPETHYRGRNEWPWTCELCNRPMHEECFKKADDLHLRGISCEAYQVTIMQEPIDMVCEEYEKWRHEKRIRDQPVIQHTFTITTCRECAPQSVFLFLSEVCPYYERTGRYEELALIYEQFGKYDEAGRARRKRLG